MWERTVSSLQPPSAADLVPRSRPPGIEDVAGYVLVPGVVARDPQTVDEPLWVRIPSFDADHEFGPAPWQPRIVSDSEFGFPTRGDRCLIAVSEIGEDPWVVNWWPYG